MLMKQGLRGFLYKSLLTDLKSTLYSYPVFQMRVSFSILVHRFHFLGLVGLGLNVFWELFLYTHIILCSLLLRGGKPLLGSIRVELDSKHRRINHSQHAVCLSNLLGKISEVAVLEITGSGLTVYPILQIS